MAGFAGKIGAEVSQMQKTTGGAFKAWAKGLLGGGGDKGKAAGDKDGASGKKAVPSADATSSSTQPAGAAAHEVKPGDDVPLKEEAPSHELDRAPSHSQEGSDVTPTHLQLQPTHYARISGGGGSDRPASTRFQDPDPAAEAVSRLRSLRELDHFRRQLSHLTLRSYGLLRDLFKKRLAALLPACVQQLPPLLSGEQSLTPRASQDDPGVSPPSYAAAASTAAAVASGRKEAAVPSTADLGSGVGEKFSAMRPWVDLIAVLHDGLVSMSDQGVPAVVAKCIMRQTLAFINVQVRGFPGGNFQRERGGAESLTGKGKRTEALIPVLAY